MPTINAAAAEVTRYIITPSSTSLAQERTDIISHAAVGANLLKSENSNGAVAGAAIVAFGLEEKQTAEQTEMIGHAAAIGSEWRNYVNTLAEQWLPESILGYVKDYFTPVASSISGAAYAAIGIFERPQIDFD